MKKIWLLLAVVLALGFPKGARAEQRVMEGKVTKIVSEEPIDVLGRVQILQKLEVKISRGEDQGKSIEMESGEVPIAGQGKFKLNDKVLVAKDENQDGKTVYQIIDYVRRDSLTLLFALFVGITLLVAGKAGASSIVSMAGTFVIIMKYMLPQISTGANPIAVALIASMIIIPVTFVMSHGWGKKTGVAIAGTIMSLAITSLLSSWMIGLAKLSGLSSEESGFLMAYNIGGFDARGLLLAGIIIGGLGVLDDITIAQAGIVEDIMKNSEKIKLSKVYERAMVIGRDHITSMVNTLILVYAGAAMPLLLLFTEGNRNFQELLNYEFMAEEVVRTLTGSIGLIAAVPVTTLLACLIYNRWGVDKTSLTDSLPMTKKTV